MSSVGTSQRSKITDCSEQNAAVDGMVLAMSFSPNMG